jgi:hypothetical protein
MISEEDQVLLRQAASALKIKDVALYGSNFRQERPLPRKGVEVEQQQMEGWHYTKARSGKQDWLQVLYKFGVRLSKPSDEKTPDGGHAYYTIEAEFVAHYQFVDGDLSEEAIKAFAEYNAKHNIWPFWREYVFAICQRARISPPEIGLYSSPCE